MHGVLLQQLVVAPHPAPPSTKPSRNGEHIHRRPPATYNLADLWITWRRRPMSVENAEVIDIMVLSDDHTRISLVAFEQRPLRDDEEKLLQIRYKLGAYVDALRFPRYSGQLVPPTRSE